MEYDEDFDWGVVPLHLCLCGQMLQVECEEHCIGSVDIYPIPSDPYSIDIDESYTSRVGTLQDFDTEFFIAELREVDTGLDADWEYFWSFPELDLPDWEEQPVIDTFTHPEDSHIRVEVRCWSDGQVRKLMYCDH